MLKAARVVPLRVAFADESFSDQPTSGFYVLAAAVVEPDMCEEVREAMLGLRQRLRGHKAGDKL
ncbi:MAG: hypothetical protein LC799_32695, partial [Actinobacteria bacterium]|nr:hypothetical protein [Actinomycetota bacterium]